MESPVLCKRAQCIVERLGRNVGVLPNHGPRVGGVRQADNSEADRCGQYRYTHMLPDAADEAFNAHRESR